MDYSNTNSPNYEETFLSSSTAYQTPNDSNKAENNKSLKGGIKFNKSKDAEMCLNSLTKQDPSSYMSPAELMIEIPLTATTTTF